MEKVWSWVKSHPWYAAAIVFAVGILLFLLLRKGGGATVAAANPYDAYYGALANSTASGNALQAAQNSTAAQTAQTQIGAGAAVDIARINADAATTTAGYAAQVANTASQTQSTIASLMQSLGIAQTNAAADVAKTQVAGGVAAANIAGNTQQYADFISNYVDLQKTAYQFGQGVTGLAPLALAPSSRTATDSSGATYSIAVGGAANNNLPVTNGPVTGAASDLIKNYGYDPRQAFSY